LFISRRRQFNFSQEAPQWAAVGVMVTSRSVTFRCGSRKLLRGIFQSGLALFIHQRIHPQDGYPQRRERLSDAGFSKLDAQVHDLYNS
jgi:hypothetical protein